VTAIYVKTLSTHYIILVSSVLVVSVYETCFFLTYLIFDQVLASYLWFCFPSFFATLSYPTSLQLSFSKATNVAQEPYLHHQSK